MEKLDIVYVVRDGEDNEPLRYSLRSLVNLPHNRVIISGYMPSWIDNCTGLLTDQENKPDQQNSNHNLHVACKMDNLTEDIIMFNDDFFSLEPVPDIPTMHQGSLDARIAAYETGNRFHQAYSLITTRKALVASGLSRDELLSYELHMPMVINRRKALSMFQKWDKPLFSLRPRTMYGNLFAIGGKETKDAKGATQPVEGFISTETGFNGPQAARIKAQFTAPCQYEKQ